MGVVGDHAISANPAMAKRSGALVGILSNARRLLRR